MARPLPAAAIAIAFTASALAQGTTEPPSMQALAPGEAPPAGYGVVVFKRTGSVIGGGILNARVKVGGREVCSVARNGECAVALREGDHAIEVDNAATVGTAVGKLPVRAQRSYEAVIGTKASSALFAGFGSGLQSSDPSVKESGFALSKDTSSFTVTIASMKEVAPGSAPAGTGSWDARIAALQAQKGKLAYPSAMVTLFELPFGIEREALLVQESEARNVSQGAAAVGVGPAGLVYAFATVSIDAGGAERDAMRLCQGAAEPGSCRIVLASEEFKEDGMLEFARALRERDYGATRAASIQTLKAYQ